MTRKTGQQRLVNGARQVEHQGQPRHRFGGDHAGLPGHAATARRTPTIGQPGTGRARPGQLRLANQRSSERLPQHLRPGRARAWQVTGYRAQQGEAAVGSVPAGQAIRPGAGGIGNLFRTLTPSVGQKIGLAASRQRPDRGAFRPIAPSGLLITRLPGPARSVAVTIVNGAVQPLDIPLQQLYLNGLSIPKGLAQQRVEVNRLLRQPQPGQMRQRAVDQRVGAGVVQGLVDIAQHAGQLRPPLHVPKSDVQGLVGDPANLLFKGQGRKARRVKHRIPIVGHRGRQRRVVINVRVPHPQRQPAGGGRMLNHGLNRSGAAAGFMATNAVSRRRRHCRPPAPPSSAHSEGYPESSAPGPAPALRG